MKKFLFLVLFAGLVISASAQRASILPLVAGDTIVNTGTVTKTLPVITGGFSGVYIGATLSKISGTGAGTAQLQASVDGTNYFNVGSAFTITNVATQVANFSVSAPVPPYLQILFTGSGTESVAVKVYYVYRKYQSQAF